MSKYGLNLRPQQKKQPSRPPLPTALGFGNDNDDDVEKEISRHASKNKSLKDIEEQQRKALEEDPSAFDYDGVYDEMKAKNIQPKAQDREERKPKYIQNLLRKAEERQREQEIVYERKLAKERSQEDHLYADKDKFVTSAYKRKLAEQAKWMEEERLRQLREERDDVTKKTDLSDFYFNLQKNVAFGAKDVELRKQDKPAEEIRKPDKHKHGDALTAEELRKPYRHGDGASVEALDRKRSLSSSNSMLESSTVREQHHSETSLREPPSESSNIKPVSDSNPKTVPDTGVQENSSVKQPSVEQPKLDHHKRSEDAVAAAKARFLARKRAKEQ